MEARSSQDGYIPPVLQPMIQNNSIKLKEVLKITVEFLTYTFGISDIILSLL